MRARIVGISFAVQPGEAAYIPLAHNYAGAPDQLPLDEVLAQLKPWLEDAGARQARPEHQVRHAMCSPTHGIAVRGYAHDTMLQSYVLEAHKPHSLESLAERHLGRKRPELRRPVRQGREPDPVRAGRHRSAPPSTPARTAR